MEIDVRVPEEPERERWFDVCGIAFSGEVRPDDRERDTKLLPRDRMLAAYVDGELVGTAGDFPLALTIPGGELPVAGVTMVGVVPSHRRRGVLTALMGHQLADARGRGEPLAILWSSEAGIYGRYGYGVATRASWLEADRDRVSFRAPADAGARVRLIDAEEALKILPPVYDRFRRSTPGAISRSELWWREYRLADDEHRRRGAGPKFYAVLELDGEAEAFAIYRVKEDWPEGFAASSLRVQETAGNSPRAVRELWRFLFGVDLVARVEAWNVPPDHPLFLLTAEPRRLRMRIGDGLWVRVLDIKAALAARSYAAAGEVAFEITDPLVPENEGVWRLQAGAEGASVERGGDPELRLGVAALGSTYLGGFSFAELQAAELVEELSDGAIARADALFRTARAPWCLEVF